MCRESLVHYLLTELQKQEPDLFLTQGDVETFIRYGEMAGENDAHVEKKGQETRRYSYKIPGSIRTRTELIDRKLADIRVCDPAVGSGPFWWG